MAKLNGPLGSKLRGKVGEVVAAKTVGGDSAIAACFSTALEIGYAQAVSGMRMYPRNLAVRDFLANDGFLVQQSVDEFAIDASSFPVSKRAGILVKPSCTYSAPTAQTAGSLTCNNAAAVEVNTAVEQLGIVYVIGRMFETGECEFIAIKQSAADTPVTVTVAEAGNWSDSYVWAFFKKIPLSGTIVPTTTTPWKYPSDNSEAAMVAHVS